MDDLKVKFGRRLRYLRRKKEFSQEQLAEAIDVSVRFISYLERGINAPSFETLEKITKALNVEPKDLFDFNNQ